MSAASESMRRSTSQSETTSTGDTWMRRKRSPFPYQPVPIMPTRSGFEPCPENPRAAAPRPAAPVRMNWRRFMYLLCTAAASRDLQIQQLLGVIDAGFQIFALAAAGGFRVGGAGEAGRGWPRSAISRKRAKSHAGMSR